MSKNYQISQYEIPLCKDGFLKVNEKRIGITRINLEEDPARIVHMSSYDDVRRQSVSITQAKYVLVDYNRSGSPLCEIVTRPDLTSAEEARNFLQELSSMLEYLEVYDSSIEGSLRVDANISVDTARVEVKNITGFKDVEKALSYEIIRQNNLLRRGEKVQRETRGWDSAAGVTRSLRLKEEEEEYGYIFEGDLPKITLDEKLIERLKKEMPEFAHQKVARYKKELGISKDLATAITVEPEIAKFFEMVVKDVDPKLAASFFAGALKKSLNYKNLRLKDTKLKPEHLIRLIKMIENRKVTEHVAELILRDIVVHPHDPEELLEAKDLTRISDEKEIGKIVTDVMAENIRAVIDYRTGRKEAFEFLVGQVMRKMRGRGDPATIRIVLKKKLEKEG